MILMCGDLPPTLVRNRSIIVSLRPHRPELVYVSPYESVQIRTDSYRSELILSGITCSGPKRCGTDSERASHLANLG